MENLKINELVKKLKQTLNENEKPELLKNSKLIWVDPKGFFSCSQCGASADHQSQIPHKTTCPYYYPRNNQNEN